MDIQLTTDNKSFKFRVVGLLKNKNGKYLVQRISDNPFYCFPGGHVEIGESTDVAVKRELDEELNFDVKVEKLSFMIENFYYSLRTNTNMHELGFYYELSSEFCPGQDSWQVIENENGVDKVLEYKWVSLPELKNLDIRPGFLKNILGSDEKELKRYIFREQQF